MPLVPYVDPETADDRTRELLAADAERYGRPSLFARAMSNNPDVFAIRQEYFERLAGLDAIDSTVLELIYVAVSTANDCEYCIASHAERLVEHVGLSDSRVEAIAAGDRSELDERERAVVETATQVATDPKRLSAADLDRLRGLGFDDAALVALVTTVTAAIAANTFADAFDVLPADRDDNFERYVPDDAA